MPPQDLVNIPILALSDDDPTGKPKQIKVHPKHVRRLRELRLARCLTKERVVDIGHFTSLRQLYLDGGAEDPEVLSEIGLNWHGPQPLLVIFGLSNQSPRPLFKQLPSLNSATYEISSGAKLSLSDANSAQFILGPSQTLPPNISTWPKLTQLYATIEAGGEIRLKAAPALSLLTVHLRDIGNLEAKGEPLSFESLSIRLMPRLLRTPEIETIGDVNIFTTLSMTVDGRNDPLAIVKHFPGLTGVRFEISPPRSRQEIEEIVSRIATEKCLVTAAQSTGMFQSEEFDSGSRSWTLYTGK